MTRTVRMAVGVAFLALAALPTRAGAASGHEGHAGMSHGGAAQAAPQGAVIREAKAQGYSLTYRLYSWEERNVMMKGMEGHEMAGMDNSGKSTNHLMLFIAGADGKEVSGAKVGFIVTAPDKSEQKTLTMAMSGGYGADVALKAGGEYRIKTKAVIGDTTLGEEFPYAVK